MKRKRSTIIGYEKDELLNETTSLNLQYNREFNLDTNILIYEFAKDKTPEIVYELNQLLKRNIKEHNYMDMDNIKQIILYK